MSGALGFVLATYAVPSPLGDTGLPTKLPPASFFVPPISPEPPAAGRVWAIAIVPLGVVGRFLGPGNRVLVSDPTNYYTITVTRTPPGGSPVAIASAVETTPTGTGDWFAYQPIALTPIPMTMIRSNDTISISITQNGFPPTLPSFLVLASVEVG